MDFLWHSVSEKEKEEIKKEAKRILDSFAKALAKAEKAKPKEEKALVERKSQIRKETVPVKTDPAFRKLFFKNIPEKNGDWVKAEKGAWK